ncbi:SOS response-associated peptidase [Sphingobacterium spiritivorum]|uniref:SOS response-associated peptidase n=1 Tax=Sphingobacterium spiritivorum TaxID=258 RepID=UPI003DA514CC
MCYHVSSPDTDFIKKSVPTKVVKYNRAQNYHVSGFTRPFLPVELNNQLGLIDEARWKLLPFWVKTEEDAAKYANTLNAESESIFQKASYKNYILKNRGLLYIDGFFEPHKVKGQKETDNYYLFMPEKKIFTLGIVWSPFTDIDTGEHYNTFSIITTPANPQLKEIHNEKERMPLIIPESDREAWLNAKTKEQVSQLMIPYKGDLENHKVYRVTAARGEDTNRPDIQDAI